VSVRPYIRVNIDSCLDLVDSRRGGKVHLGGDAFWIALKEVFGRAVVNTAKLTMHPLTANSETLDLSGLRMGSTEFVAELRLGTASATGAAKFKQRTVYKKMKKMVEQGDPIMTLTLRYKTGRASHPVVLFEFNAHISEILHAESHKTSIRHSGTTQLAHKSSTAPEWSPPSVAPTPSEPQARRVSRTRSVTA